jgi:hypothetical protein
LTRPFFSFLFFSFLALDQFLEHVFEHDPNIVRVGGRSKSSILKEHTLYELKKQHESPKKMAGLYRTRDEMKTKIKRLIIEMYEKPCVTIDYINKINGLRPRQLDSLKRIVEKEKKAKDTNSTLANFDDSDDDFIMYPDEPVLPAKSATKGSRRAKFSRDRKGKKEPPKHQKQQQQQSHRRDNTNLWAGGNPNTPVVVQPAVNPVELWLKDAIEYVTDDGAIMSLANDLKEDLLETDKGLDFGDTDDRELIEEEELEELQQAFKGEDQDRSFMNEFIRIGKAFQKTTESEPGERPERKVVNYKKTVAQKEFDPSTFSFFDDDDGGDDSSNTMANEPNEPNENDYHILERWTKEDDVSMWPLSARLQAHKRWVNQRNTEIEATIVECMRRYVEISKDIRKIWTTHEAKICRENRVVGMTSTAAAKYHDLLEAMKPRIMVVEEAAEMLESHIISALTKSLEHLILIG